MEEKENRPLSFREYLALGASYPPWVYELLSIGGFVLFVLELVNDRFGTGAIYFLVSGINFARIYIRQTQTAYKTAELIGGILAFTGLALRFVAGSNWGVVLAFASLAVFYLAYRESVKARQRASEATNG